LESEINYFSVISNEYQNYSEMCEGDFIITPVIKTRFNRHSAAMIYFILSSKDINIISKVIEFYEYQGSVDTSFLRNVKIEMF
jgi:hypothetical protein